MIPRLLSAFIILFWLATTGMLVRSIWFGEESRFEPVDPTEALGAFFQWNETSTLTIVENGQKIGQMVVSGFEGRDPRTGDFARGLSTQGTLDGRAESTGESGESLVGTSWRLTADFGESIELEHFDLKLRIPQQELDVRLALEGEPATLGARVIAGEMVIYETGSLAEGSQPGVAPGTLPAPVAGALPPQAAMGWLPGGGLVASDPEAWKPDVKASRGLMVVAGSRQPVYLVEVRLGSDLSSTPLKLYFSEAGEPWRIDTGWGYEAMAEVLIPIEGGGAAIETR